MVNCSPNPGGKHATPGHGTSSRSHPATLRPDGEPGAASQTAVDSTPEHADYGTSITLCIVYSLTEEETPGLFSWPEDIKYRKVPRCIKASTKVAHLWPQAAHSILRCLLGQCHKVGPVGNKPEPFPRLTRSHRHESSSTQCRFASAKTYGRSTSCVSTSSGISNEQQLPILPPSTANVPTAARLSRGNGAATTRSKKSCCCQRNDVAPSNTRLRRPLPITSSLATIGCIPQPCTNAQRRTLQTATSPSSSPSSS